jgi:hypothetical protein
LSDSGGKVSVRPERAFELRVRRVCRPCNNNWMEKLDNAAEKWVFGVRDAPSLDFSVEEVHELRRWAVKVAMMRWLIDPELDVVDPSEYAEVHAGQIPDGWHVFIGRTKSSFIHGTCGWPHGALRSNPARLFGVRQASWSLGSAVTVVIRAVYPSDQEPPADPVDSFRKVNALNGFQMRELGDGPLLFTHVIPTVPDADLSRMFWFYTLGN